MTVQHIFTGSGAPAQAPSSIGAHYIDETSGDQYLSRGTASTDDWVRVSTGLSVGDLLYTLRSPGADFLAVNGGPFNGDEYPLLAELLPAKAWQQLGDPLPTWATPRLPGTDNEGAWLWAIDSGLYRSLDDGVTWTQIATGWNAYRDAEYAGGTWIVAGPGVVRRSTDGGDSWTEEFVGSTRTVSIATDGAGNWVALTPGGFSYNHEQGAGDWSMASGDGSADIWGRVMFGNGVWVGVANGTITRSTDDGETWSSVQSGAGSSRALATDGNGVWIYGAADKLWRSTDDGATWTEGALAYSGVSISGAVYISGSFIVSFSSYGEPKAARSPDGQNWVDDAAFPGGTGDITTSSTGVALGARQTYNPVRYAEGELIFLLPEHEAPEPFAAYIKAR